MTVPFSAEDDVLIPRKRSRTSRSARPLVNADDPNRSDDPDVSRKQSGEELTTRWSKRLQTPSRKTRPAFRESDFEGRESSEEESQSAAKRQERADRGPQERAREEQKTIEQARQRSEEDREKASPTLSHNRLGRGNRREGHNGDDTVVELSSSDDERSTRMRTPPPIDAESKSSSSSSSDESDREAKDVAKEQERRAQALINAR
jgi:hypothetical protein